jgi:hypothetical protein
MDERKYNNEMKVLKKYGYDVPKYWTITRIKKARTW